MKRYTLLLYALSGNTALLLFFFYQYKKQTALVSKTEQLKHECNVLAKQSEDLTKQCNKLRNRSNVEAYAQNNLGMKKIIPSQKQIAGNI